MKTDAIAARTRDGRRCAILFALHTEERAVVLSLGAMRAPGAGLSRGGDSRCSNSYGGVTLDMRVPSVEVIGRGDMVGEEYQEPAADG